MRIDVVYGTRPEVLKLLPVLHELRAHPGAASVRTVFTGQQAALVRPLLKSLGEQPQVDLGEQVAAGPLAVQLGAMLQALDGLLVADPPRWLLVQGDTLSAFAGALAAFYRKIPVAHVEAGLRTHDVDNPFPEEVHRQLVARTATLHFAPTPASREHLLLEGVPPANVLVTGNTSVDLLRLVAGAAPTGPAIPLPQGDAFLVTVHRRENLPCLETDILPGFVDLLAAFPRLHLLWVLHPGESEAPIVRVLHEHPRVRLVPPVDHLDLLNLLPRVRGVFTDSGGLTEECATLGVPTLLLRRVTERGESLLAGNAVLLGNRRGEIVERASALLADAARLAAMARPSDAFGDGRAAVRIVKRLLEASPDD